jgi:hypothetical protein
MAEHTLGHPDASNQALDPLIANFANAAAYQIAEAYAWRGEKEHAFEWLDRAYRQRDAGLSEIKASVPLALLRDDPRFAAMALKLGLPP